MDVSPVGFLMVPGPAKAGAAGSDHDAVAGPGQGHGFHKSLSQRQCENGLHARAKAFMTST
jgi:hypothetical protein